MAKIGINIATGSLQKEEIIQARTKFPFWKDADFFHIQ
jgi:hypothetical protein